MRVLVRIAAALHTTFSRHPDGRRRVVGAFVTGWGRQFVLLCARSSPRRGVYRPMLCCRYEEARHGAGHIYSQFSVPPRSSVTLPARTVCVAIAISNCAEPGHDVLRQPLRICLKACSVWSLGASRSLEATWRYSTGNSARSSYVSPTSSRMVLSVDSTSDRAAVIARLRDRFRSETGTCARRSSLRMHPVAR